jgi:hypothetical protein
VLGFHILGFNYGTQTGYLNKHYNINQKDEDTYEDRERDGGTNFILRIQGTGITPNPS